MPVPETVAETETETEPETETATETVTAAETETETDTTAVTDANTEPETEMQPTAPADTGTTGTDPETDRPSDTATGCTGTAGGLSGLLVTLLLVLILSLCVSCNKDTTPPAESATATETATETTTAPATDTDTDADTETEPETETATETETETETETVPIAETEHATGDYSLSPDEQAALREEAERMKGLTATYYSDRNATQAVSAEVVATVDRQFKQGSGISAATYKGYITFAESGTYTVSLDGGAQTTISIGQGEHHVQSGTSVTIEAVAGAQYSIEIQATWRGDKADMTLRLLANDSTEGFSLSVGRILMEHEDVSATVIHDIPLRDTFICTGPDGYYYMTGTTGPDFWNNNYVIHIYRLEDLADWEDLGVVWDFRTDATWAKTVTNDTRVPVWAPELAYINGNWYMTYSLGFNDGYCGGILVSTTGKPEGPYTDTTTSKLVDNIDGSLFQDDDGTVYYIYDEGLIAPLKDDLSGFAGEFTPLLAADGLPVGFEGCYIFKHDGRYYLTAATYNQSYNADGKLITTYDSMIAVSDSLYGPYSDTRLLLRDGGHNNLFCDKKGNLYTTLFSPNGAQGFSCQPAIVRLKEDERGILSVAVPKTETVEVAENGVFRYIYGEGDIPSLSVSIKTRRPLDVYINGVYAFTARPSSVAMTYTISGDALAALVSGLNRISFSDTRNADLAYDLVISYIQ